MNVFSLLVVGLTVFFKGFVNSETSIQKIEGTYFHIKEKIGPKKNNIEWSKESYMFPQGPYSFSCDMTNTITCLADDGNILFTLKKNKENIKIKRTKNSNTGYSIQFQVLDSYNVTRYLAGYKLNTGKENTNVTMLSIVGTLSGIMIMFGDKIIDYCKSNKKCKLLLSSKHTQNNTTGSQQPSLQINSTNNNNNPLINENTNNEISGQSSLKINPTNTKPKTKRTREFYNNSENNNNPLINENTNNEIEIEMIEKGNNNNNDNSYEEEVIEEEPNITNNNNNNKLATQKKQKKKNNNSNKNPLIKGNNNNNDNSDEEKVIEEITTKNGMTENENITNNNNNNYGKNNNKPATQKKQEDSNIDIEKLANEIYGKNYFVNDTTPNVYKM